MIVRDKVDRMASAFQLGTPGPNIGLKYDISIKPGSKVVSGSGAPKEMGGMGSLGDLTDDLLHGGFDAASLLAWGFIAVLGWQLFFGGRFNPTGQERRAAIKRAKALPRF